MINVRLLATGLGASYSVIASIQLLFEPSMGFHRFVDFWNPTLVLPALTSIAWWVSDLCHLVNGLLLLFLAAALHVFTRTVQRAAGNLALAAGCVFVLLAMLDRAATLLPLAVPDSASLELSVVSYVATRTGVLFAGLFFLGAFVCTLAWSHRSELPFWFKLLSALVGTAAIAFALFPTPIPLVLALWAFALASVWPRRSEQAA